MGYIGYTLDRAKATDNKLERYIATMIWKDMPNPTNNNFEYALIDLYELFSIEDF
jgi:hypothetical protein